jgi:hypothetical protein
MFARLLAAFCLSNLVVLPIWGSPADQPDSEVVVYLSDSGIQPQRPLNFMKLELGHLMRAAGYRVEWSDSRDAERPSTDSQLAVVQLRGTCTLTSVPAAKVTSLASTAVSGGQIIPFSWVDCTSLTRVLSAPLAAEPGARRDFLYGRAMARLLAHELYHVLLRTGDHSREGIARPGFSATDLLTDHFEFEQGTLAKLRPSPASPVTGKTTEEAIGR